MRSIDLPVDSLFLNHLLQELSIPNRVSRLPPHAGVLRSGHPIVGGQPSGDSYQTVAIATARIGAMLSRLTPTNRASALTQKDNRHQSARSRMVRSQDPRVT